jgi:hypothetical protein
MNNKPWIALGLVIVLLLAFSVVIPVTASPQLFTLHPPPTKMAGSSTSLKKATPASASPSST